MGFPFDIKGNNISECSVDLTMIETFIAQNGVLCYMLAIACIALVSWIALKISERESSAYKKEQLVKKRIYDRLSEMDCTRADPEQEIDFWILNCLQTKSLSELNSDEFIGATVSFILLKKASKRANFSEADLRRRWDDIRREVIQ